MRLVLCLPLVLLAGAGCVQARYLVQAAGGQVDMARRARPITSILHRGEAPVRTRRLLSFVPEIKRWGEAQGLSASDNYRDYADLRRAAAVWVVQASPPLWLEERKWCFPLVGTVPYLGFFDRGAAQAFALELARKEALDVDVRPASAYSTLGWLRDPVLSTMLKEGPEALGELANVILHETVHATVYIKGQSAFDESLASFVADRMTPQWMEQALGADAPESAVWLRYQARSQARAAQMQSAWLELDALYRSTAEEAHKRAQKARILAKLSLELGSARPLNNATLVGMKGYSTGHAAFERLFSACGHSWPAFLRAVKTLGPADFPAPQAPEFDEVLERLGPSCAQGRHSPAGAAGEVG